MLIGRENELGAIERVAADARAGKSAALVLRGDPGVGKSALLARAVDVADGMRILRATGVESEAELEYSGLLELVRPIDRLLTRLPVPQSDALQVALGLGDGAPPDRFVVGAATLSLLAAAGEELPTLVLVDDAQWLDRASADAIRFAARRLLADSVGFVVAARLAGFDASGLTELVVEGVDEASAAVIAENVGGRPLGERELATLTRATGGNPLALIELVRSGLPAEPDALVPLPVTEAIERAFADRLDSLPEPTRRALCVAAADGALGPVETALRSLGLALEDLAPAEDEGLTRLDVDVVQFAHPLLRAVAYHARPASERRSTHAALAAARKAPSDAEIRAWHLAAAALGYDEEAAAALGVVAETARARGGHAAVARALERSARLTPDETTRGGRLAGAAQAAWEAGDAPHATALVAEALALVSDPAERARLTGLAGRIEFQAGDLARAHVLVLEAADALVALGDRAQAVTMMGVGSLVLHNLARPDEAATLGRRALELSEGQAEEVRMRATYHLGRALRISGRAAEATPLLEAVVAHLLEPEEPSRLALQRAAIALAVLDRPHEAMSFAQRTLEHAQASGPLQVAYALSLLAQVEMYLGEWRTAVSSAAEGFALCRDMGQDNIAATFASFLARIAGARGDGQAFDTWESHARAASETSGNRFELLQLDHARGLLALGEDRPQEAAERLSAVVDAAEASDVLDRDLAAEPDLVEVLVRLDRAGDARVVFARWCERGAREALAWAPPLVLRCAALVADDDTEAERLLTDALGNGAAVGDPYASARSQLLLGEVLRRGGRRMDARRALTAAVESFDRLDAQAWAERGRRELRASGAKLRRSAEPGDELTPQEHQIALQVAEGKANKEVAAALFLSPKTVEFHLSRIYRKLRVSSRAELVRRFAGAA